MGIKITEVRFNAFDGGVTKGFADLTFNEALVVKGFTLKEGKNGLFLSPPTKKDKNEENKWHDQVFSLTTELRQEMLEAVLAEAGLEESPF